MIYKVYQVYWWNTDEGEFSEVIEDTIKYFKNSSYAIQYHQKLEAVCDNTQTVHTEEITLETSEDQRYFELTYQEDVYITSVNPLVAKFRFIKVKGVYKNTKKDTFLVLNDIFIPLDSLTFVKEIFNFNLPNNE